MHPLSVLSVREHSEWLGMIQPSEPQGYIAVITVAIDESGTHAKAKSLCVAGCVGNYHEWKRFSREWTPRAKKYQYGFHATKARDADNQFLAQLIVKHLKFSFAVNFDYDDVRAVVGQPFRSRYGSEYAIGVRTSVGFMNEVCVMEGWKTVAYVIEDGARGADHVKQWFADMKALPMSHPDRLRVYSDTWVGKEDVTTHAADLLSYEWGRVYEGATSDIVPRLPKDRFYLHNETRAELLGAYTEQLRLDKLHRWAVIKAKKARNAQ